MQAYLIEFCASAEFHDSSMYFIWVEDADGKNRIYTEQQKIVWFWSEQQAKKRMKKLNFDYQGTDFFDVERLEYWISTGAKSQACEPDSDRIDCEFFLDFWNLFSDIAESVGKSLEPVRTKRADRCYQKLFLPVRLKIKQQKDLKNELESEQLHHYLN